jgi:hypothetical protein
VRASLQVDQALSKQMNLFYNDKPYVVKYQVESIEVLIYTSDKTGAINKMIAIKLRFFENIRQLDLH